MVQRDGRRERREGKNRGRRGMPADRCDDELRMSREKCREIIVTGGKTASTAGGGRR